MSTNANNAEPGVIVAEDGSITFEGPRYDLLSLLTKANDEQRSDTLAAIIWALPDEFAEDADVSSQKIADILSAELTRVPHPIRPEIIARKAARKAYDETLAALNSK